MCYFIYVLRREAALCNDSNKINFQFQRVDLKWKVIR